jgi:3',5'-cyclic-AMP phosphodiesterase
MPVHLPPISRRRFLAGALATGTGLFLPKELLAVDNDNATDANRWILLADIHLWQHRDRTIRNIKPADNFEEARRQILALAPRMAGVIVAGDCAFNNGQKADYAVLANLARPYREAGVPLHLALGNHDHRENFHATFPEAKPPKPLSELDKHVSIIETPRANFFLLDSLDYTSKKPGGRLGEVQLQWLANALDAHADRSAILVAHHHREGIEDFDALAKVIVPRKHVKAYIYGHTHHWGLAEFEGIHMVNLPALAWLFDESWPRGWVDARLHPDGMTLTLNTLEKKHALHGKTTVLTWRV